MNERASEESADELSPTLEDKGEWIFGSMPHAGLFGDTLPGEPEQSNTSGVLFSAPVPGRNRDLLRYPQPYSMPHAGRFGNIFPGEPEQPNTSDESSLKVEEANKKGQITEGRRVDRQNPIPENANNEGPGVNNTSRLTKMVKDKPRGSSVMWCCGCCCFRHEEK